MNSFIQSLHTTNQISKSVISEFKHTINTVIQLIPAYHSGYLADVQVGVYRQDYDLIFNDPEQIEACSMIYVELIGELTNLCEKAHELEFISRASDLSSDKIRNLPEYILDTVILEITILKNRVIEIETSILKICETLTTQDRRVKENLRRVFDLLEAIFKTSELWKK